VFISSLPFLSSPSAKTHLPRRSPEIFANGSRRTLHRILCEGVGARRGMLDERAGGRAFEDVRRRADELVKVASAKAHSLLALQPAATSRRSGVFPLAQERISTGFP